MHTVRFNWFWNAVFFSVDKVIRFGLWLHELVEEVERPKPKLPKAKLLPREKRCKPKDST